MDSGAGQPLPIEHPLRARWAEVGQLVLANLLRLNRQRANLAASTTESKAFPALPQEKPLEDPNLVKALAEYREGLRNLYKDDDMLEKVILFGSRARGTAKPDSDADLLIVLRKKFSYDREIERTSLLTAEVSVRYGIQITRGVMTRKQVESRGGAFLANLLREGREL